MPITVFLHWLPYYWLILISIFPSRQLFGLISVLHQLFYYYCTNAATVRRAEGHSMLTLIYWERLAFVSLLRCLAERRERQCNWAGTSESVPAAWWCPSTVNACMAYGPLHSIIYAGPSLPEVDKQVGNRCADGDQASWNEFPFDASS